MDGFYFIETPKGSQFVGWRGSAFDFLSLLYPFWEKEMQVSYYVQKQMPF